MSNYKNYILTSGKYEEIFPGKNDATFDDSYEYYQSVDHPFTEKMMQSIKLAVKCVDELVCLVVLGEDVMMLFGPEDQVDFNEFENRVDESFSSAVWPPDFSTMKTDEGAFFVWMENLFCIIPNTDNSEELILGKAIEYRQNIIDAYDDLTIYGIIVGPRFE